MKKINRKKSIKIYNLIKDNTFSITPLSVICQQIVDILEGNKFTKNKTVYYDIFANNNHYDMDTGSYSDNEYEI